MTLLEEVTMKVLMEIKRLKIMRFMLPLVCLISLGIFFPLTPVLGGRQNQQFQGVIMEKDPAERAIYVNETKVLVPQDTEITTVRNVRISFESLRPKQWVFVQVHLEGENLIADRIVRTPRYIPPKERGEYRFFTYKRVSR